MSISTTTWQLGCGVTAAARRRRRPDLHRGALCPPPCRRSTPTSSAWCATPTLPPTSPRTPSSRPTGPRILSRTGPRLGPGCTRSPIGSSSTRCAAGASSASCPGRARAHGAAPSAEHLAMEMRLSGPLARALARIPERQRAALLLAEVNDLTGLELAEALGISHVAARALLTRARESLRQALADERARRRSAKPRSTPHTPSRRAPADPRRRPDDHSGSRSMSPEFRPSSTAGDRLHERARLLAAAGRSTPISSRSTPRGWTAAPGRVRRLQRRRRRNTAPPRRSCDRSRRPSRRATCGPEHPQPWTRSMPGLRAEGGPAVGSRAGAPAAARFGTAIAVGDRGRSWRPRHSSPRARSPGSLPARRPAAAPRSPRGSTVAGFARRRRRRSPS